MGIAEDFFIRPIAEGTGYNIVNTLAYGGLLAIVVWVIYEKILKGRVKIDEKLGFALLPFILLGCSVRVLEDSGVLQGKFLWSSPMIWVWIAGFTLASLLASFWIEKKRGTAYWKIMALLGGLACVPALINIEFTNILAGLLILGIAGAISFGIFLLYRKGIMRKDYFAVTSAHALDASATFVSIQFFGYFEQHVLPGFLIESFGAWVMFPLKLLAIPLILFAIDRWSDDSELRNWLFICVMILGLAPGIRDTLRLTALV